MIFRWIMQSCWCLLVPTTFAAKKLLNVDDTTSNYLVYSPIAYELQEDDWLLNIELYSEEFRADLVSIWMNEIDLPATPDFRRLVKVYKKFFGAQTRRATFAKLNKVSALYHRCILLLWRLFVVPIMHS